MYAERASLPPVARASERASATQRSREREALLDLLLRATQDGIVDWDLVTRQEVYNPRFAHLFGFDDEASEDCPRDWRKLVHPEEVERARRLIEDHLVEDWPFVTTLRMRHRAGGYRNVLLRGAAQRGPSGEPVRMVIIFSDISDRIQLEARHVALAAALPDTVFRVSDAGAILELKRGEDDPDSPFRTLREYALLADCLPEAILRRLESAASRAGDVNGLKSVELVTPRGRSTALHHEARVVRAEAGEWICIVRNVSERHALAERLLQSEKLGAIGQLSAGVAHEINTPMQYIGDNLHFARSAVADLLRYGARVQALLGACAEASNEGPLATALAEAADDADVAYVSAELPRAIERSLDGIARMTAIVRALKTFAHPGGHDMAPVDLAGLVESTVAVATNEWKYVANVDVSIDPELPAVTCAGGELSQVLLNLIVNAAHAVGERVGSSGEKGRISIEAVREGPVACVSVRDTGAGIPEEIRSKVFEPFFTTKQVGKGTGQGLALAHACIVKRHGGSIDFETTVGLGTTFSVRIPIAGPSPGSP